MRRSILARVKFLSRLLTALNLLPSMATLACVSKPIMRHSANEACAHLADGGAIVLAEIGNRLVIWSQTSRQPHHLNVAPSLALKPATRMDPIEIAVNVELQQDRWMIRGSAGHLGLDTVEPKLGKIEFIHKNIDHPNRIVHADPVSQAFRK